MRVLPKIVDDVRRLHAAAASLRRVAPAALALLVTMPVLAADGAPADRHAFPSGLTEYALTEPRVRLHVAGTPLSPDADVDGVPDRVAVVARAAADTLAVCAAIGLGTQADDGDGELDILFDPRAAATSAEAVIDPARVRGRSAAGHVRVGAAPEGSARALRVAVSRAVAELVLAGRDHTAPLWWREPTALWIASRVADTTPDAADAVAARFDLPEAGVATPDRSLAAGNLALITALDDGELEARLVAASWARLADRSWTDDPVAALDAVSGASLDVTGLSLDGLLLRAALVRVATGPVPARVGLDVATLPVNGRDLDLPVAPLGAALIRLRPDATRPDATRLEVDVPDDAWTLEMLVEHERGWERLRLARDADGRVEVLVPWSDYRQAVLLALRHRSAVGPSTIAVSARAADALDPYALSAFGGRRTPAGTVEISWSTAWEQGLFGWLVERAASPAGPWQPVQEIPVPSLGLPDDGTGYALVDRRPGESETTWYRVVGITSHGLRVSGPGFAIGGGTR